MNNSSLTDVYAPIAPAMKEVRLTVAALWSEVLSLVGGSASMGQGQRFEGKLLRPALCLLSAGALGEEDQSGLVRLAAAYEAIHMASLAHDDVVDHASLRRGSSSLNELWNEHAAILGGDYLVARSFEILLEYECPDLLKGALYAMRRMAGGELRFFDRNPQETDKSDCITLADTKTASLFAAVCAGPASLFDKEKVDTLYQFGIDLGIAFQLIDDLLDLTQTAAALGKPECGDVMEGKQTLPLVVMRQRMDDEERDRLQALKGQELDDDDCEWIKKQVDALEVAAFVREEAESYIEKALQSISVLPSSLYRQSLEGLTHFVLNRLS